MSVDTYGKLKGKIEPEQILNFIQHKYDKNATMNIHTEKYGALRQYDWIKEHYGKHQQWQITSGRINFKDGEEDRGIFYFYDNINSYENLDFYTKFGLEDMVKSETTHIGLGCYGNSVEIIKSIVTEFGGWIDENDCDDKEYYPILKDSDGNIKKVIHVTMQDIYDKFGGIVIIDRED